MSGPRIVLVAGTRPEFVKLYPLAVALQARSADVVLITTEQHAGASMRDDFIDKLQWPCAVERLTIQTQAPLALLAGILGQLGDRLRPGDTVVAEGDTTSVLAASLVANKLRLRLAHVEAGLRSYDLRMPEEHNRRICDHIADELFAPTEIDAAHLRDERCPGAVHTTGNTVMDAVRLNAGRAGRPGPFAPGYTLVTLHRQENLDDPEFVRAVVGFLGSMRSPCLFPIHPRTRDVFGRRGVLEQLMTNTALRICDPLHYLAFMAAMRDANVIVTDSGGVQEEATAPEIRRPVVVLRRSTERTPAVVAGFSVLGPFEADGIAELVQHPLWFRPAAESPFGDGHAAERIADVLLAQ